LTLFRFIACLLLSLPLLQFAQGKAAYANAPAVAKSYSFSSTETETVLKIALDKPVEARSFALGSPYRVIVDLSEVSFQFAKHGIEIEEGSVRSFRYGLFAPGKSRMVLDVESPVLVTRDITKTETGYDLLIRMTLTDEKTFYAAYAPLKPKTTKPVAPLNDAADLKGKIVVVIDAGHGGVDPGAIGKGGIREKELVLSVAKELRSQLAKKGNFEVHMTREDDTFIALSERVEIARRLNADLFISIHADSIRSQSHSVRGATVYTLSERASDAQAAALADKENRADLIAGVEVDVEQSEVADILIDLVRRETKNFSVFFARTFVDRMEKAVRMNNNPHRFAGFRVLKAPDVPSVLIELGYLSNAEDEALLSSKKWQKTFATSAAEAISGYFEVRLAGNGG